MKRQIFEVEKVTDPSRREFLLAGGATITMLSFHHAYAVDLQTASDEREKIREIMKRYGSELGQARYLEKE